jgi:N6-L-threonylcarbamoyladenine synthase
VPTTPCILAIETSCDETAAAVIDGDGILLSNVVSSQISSHARFGGVVPEIASRKHTENICQVVETALTYAGEQGKLPAPIDAIAVTYAPGLVGALVVGVAFAKGMAWAADLPLIVVNHLEGHIYANRLEGASIASPFVIALLSGGHTMLVHVRAWGDYTVLGQTLDDAVGEAFDKVAKALGLGYPGGPVISKLAAQGDPKAIDFPRALLYSHDLQFSLSGLKTAVVTYVREQVAAGAKLSLPDVAASFEAAVIDVQVAKAKDALAQTGAKTFAIGGGVAANKALRRAYIQALEPLGINVVVPPALACTDNAAMIARVALDRYAAQKFAPLSIDAHPRANLAEDY